MGAENPGRVEELFGQAIELARTERARFLDRACGTSGWLREEVDSLLAADERSSEFLAEPERQREPLLGSPFLSRAPPRVGPFELVRLLGEGGMATVYLGVRADDQFQQRVAIKFLRYGTESSRSLRRFESERHILASLTHPSIAKLYDAGATAEGRPYLVMEYVEGEPINEHCDRLRLTIEERLRLFRSVCSAVAHAHRNLVVHRDLKPSNILVTAEGIPKLLDFGIAKLLNPELAASSLPPTTARALPLTPSYASPEQMLGKLVTTASDVYSLGVLLYQLLSGHLPHLLQGRLPGEAERLVAEEEPEPPSHAIDRVGAERASVDVHWLSRARQCSLKQLRRQLSGDLDTIVAKALRKEPQRRYGSVEQLSEDIQRHLDGLPVRARPSTLRYRAGRAIRRHRLAIGVAAVFLAVILTAIGVLATLSARLAEERGQAERQRDKARQVAALVESFFAVVDPDQARGKNLTARELLDLGAARIQDDLSTPPEARAILQSILGNIYRRLGLYDRAKPLLSGALAQRRETLGPRHPEVADSLVGLAFFYRDTGDYSAAEKLLREALELRRELLGEGHPFIARNLCDLGGALWEQGWAETAEKHFFEALGLLRQLRPQDPVGLMFALNGLGSVLWERGEYEAAEKLLREDLELRRRVYGEVHSAVAQGLNNLAMVLKDKGEVAAAEPLAREALVIWEKLLGEGHPSVLLARNNLANLTSTRGDFEEAAPLYREVLKRSREVLGDSHPKLSYPLLGLGRSLSELGDAEGGEQFLREAVEIRRRSLPQDHLLVAWAEHWLGRSLLLQQRYAEAEPLLLASHRSIARQLPREDPKTIQATRGLAELYQAWDKPEKAAEALALLEP